MRKLPLKMGELKIKVCGLRDNIAQVATLKPDYAGFIFYPKSPRYVGKNFEMPPMDASIKKVGVFVNESERLIIASVRRYQLDYVQLHGDESPQICQALKAEGIGVIKAFAIIEEFNFAALNGYEETVDYFLFDTKTKKYGGSGQTFDWQILANYRLDKRYFLSGGIAMKNLGDLNNVDLVKVHAIDVNSRFERSPGLKDVRLLSKLKSALAGAIAERKFT